MQRLSFLRAAFVTLALCGAAHGAGISADPDFNGARHFVDRFAGSSGDNFVGEAVVRLPSGEAIVAGRVSWGTQTDPALRLNIGLVRYSAAGQRLVWGSGADTAYTHNARQYLVYPKAPTSLVRRVVDVVALGGYVHVLVDRDGTGGCGSFCERDVSLATFRIDTGELVGFSTAFDTTFDEYSAGLVAQEAGFGTARLLVIGTKNDPGHARPIFKQFVMASATGVLTPSPDFSVDASGYRELAFPTSMCAVAACDVTADHIATYGGSFIPTGIYIGGRDYNHNNGADYFFARVNMYGVRDPAFGDDGVTHFPVASGNANNDLWPGGVQAMAVAWGGFSAPDQLYFLASNGGTFVFASRVLPSGALDTNFGRIGFGYLPAGLTRAGGLYLANGMLHAAGQWRAAIGAPDPADAAVTRFAANANYQPGTAFTPERVLFPAKRANGTRYGDAMFSDIAFDPDNGGFWAAGDARDESAGNTQMFDTLRVCVTTACTVFFGDGFEVAP